MHTLYTAINESIKEQHAITAVENCFHTWDGNIDQEVIEQGMISRLRACGIANPGVKLSRDGVFNTRIMLVNLDDGKTIWDVEVVGSQIIDGYSNNYFRASEMIILGKYMESFYHTH